MFVGAQVGVSFSGASLHVRTARFSGLVNTFENVMIFKRSLRALASVQADTSAKEQRAPAKRRNDLAGKERGGAARLAC